MNALQNDREFEDEYLNHRICIMQQPPKHSSTVQTQVFEYLSQILFPKSPKPHTTTNEIDPQQSMHNVGVQILDKEDLQTYNL